MENSVFMMSGILNYTQDVSSIWQPEVYSKIMSIFIIMCKEKWQFQSDHCITFSEVTELVECVDGTEPSEDWVKGSWIFFCNYSKAGDDGGITSPFLLRFDLSKGAESSCSGSKFLKLGAMFCILIKQFYFKL